MGFGDGHQYTALGLDARSSEDLPLEYLEFLQEVQGLMVASLHASTPSMAAASRRVLGPLHGAKSAPGVDALLLRLYQPILFRALAAANPAVRRNALGLLIDAFPLQVCQQNLGCTAPWSQTSCRCTVMRLENFSFLSQSTCYSSRPICANYTWHTDVYLTKLAKL